MRFRTINSGRQLDTKVVGEIAKMLAQGGCKNTTYPLIVAINAGEIDPKSLVSKYDTITHTPKLGRVKFHSADSVVEVLAGYRRVMAAQQAVDILDKRLKELEEHVGVAQEDHDDGDFDPDKEVTRIDVNVLDGLTNLVGAIEG
jgi:hypothetical protein